MAVKIRLARRGRKKAAIYDIIVADARSPRDGKFIEKLGTYNPNTNPASINFDQDKAFQWMMNGAQPTDTVKAMLSYTGVLFRRHLQIGVIKGAISQETADARLEEWKKEKETKIEGKRQGLVSDKEAKRKAALEAETKVKEARAEAIRQREADKAAANAPAESTEEAPEAAAEGDSTEEQA
jgi:small subunit ribosomal protein S16